MKTLMLMKDRTAPNTNPQSRKERNLSLRPTNSLVSISQAYIRQRDTHTVRLRVIQPEVPEVHGREGSTAIAAESCPGCMAPASWLSICHDLRSPLSAICASSELLMDMAPTAAQVRRLASNINRAAGRMRDLLAEVSGPAGGIRACSEMTNLREVILAASESAAVVADNPRVAISMNVPSQLELPMVGTQMERVFFNLIANSLEVMPNGGQIRVLATNSDGFVRIEIEDTGPGIPLAIRDRLFQPFVTAGKKHGLGLGLALSRQIVIDHGGDLWNEPARGARFVMRLRGNANASRPEMST